MNEQIDWGLVAVGATGKIDIDVLEGTTEAGLTVWQVTFYFLSQRHHIWFRIASPQILTDVLQFVEKTYRTNEGGWVEIGRCFGCPVTLVKDEELNDRYFMHIRDINGAGYWQTSLFGEEVADLISALRQAAKELKD